MATEIASLIRNRSSAAVSRLNELLLLNCSPEFASQNLLLHQASALGSRKHRTSQHKGKLFSS